MRGVEIPTVRGSGENTGNTTFYLTATIREFRMTAICDDIMTSQIFTFFGPPVNYANPSFSAGHSIKDKDKLKACNKEKGSTKPKLIFFEFGHFVLTWNLNERLKINDFM